MDEVANNEIIGLAELLLAGQDYLSQPAYYATVENDEGIRGCAVQSLPESFFVSGLPNSAVVPLLQDRIEFGQPVKWATAETKTAAAIADCWSNIFGGVWEEMNRWQVHQTSEINADAQCATGLLRCATANDSSCIEEWGEIFAVESPSPLDIPEFLLRKMNEGNLYFWDDNGPRSLCAISGNAMSVVRISAVFTPNEHRGKGYARACVATLVSELLSAGHKRCMLLTDLAKPNLTKLYASIGFMPHSQRMSVKLRRD
ncbi:MAG: hypothetical protein KJO31_08035 [Gammaproteobacteria bacterium]|nr:hypothetical protein [Gammaproteobacteria bacterium]